MLGPLLRSLARNHAHSAFVVLILALGIGAATAIFSVVHGVVLAPLPYPDADRISAVRPYWRGAARPGNTMSGPDLRDVAAQCEACEATAFYFGGEMAIRVGESGEFARFFLVSDSFFPLLGVKPAAGVFPRGSDPHAAVSDAFARRMFGSPEAALGKPVRLLDRAFQVTAVLPPGVSFPEKSDLWIPATHVPQSESRTAHNYRVITRRKADVTQEALDSQLRIIASRLEQQHPSDNRNKTFVATPLKETLVGGTRRTLYLLLGAVGLLLLIACANVANLMLARGLARAREFAVRLTLGASRSRLVAQLTAESLLLAGLGCAAGVVLAALTLDGLLALAPPDTPRLADVRLSLPVLAAAVGISLLSSVLFGLLPALRISGVDLTHNLKQGGARGLLGAGPGRLRSAIVFTEIALSFVLVLSAGLLFRSFLALNAVDPGYQVESRLVVGASLPAEGQDGHQRAIRELQRAVDAVAALPGVLSASAAMGLPNGPYGSNGAYLLEGAPMLADWTKMPQAGFRLAAPGYFRTLGVPLLAGREFQPADTYEAVPVAIVSKSLARASFPNENPLGKRIKCGLDRDVWMTIVGIVGDVRNDSPATPPQPELYMPLDQHPFHANDLHIVARAAVPPDSLQEPVRRAIRGVNPEIAMKQTTLSQLFSTAVALPRFQALLLGIFAALAVLLAVAGVYGLMSYHVASRGSEFGLRLALGASSGGILRLSLSAGLRLIAAGLAGGAAGSFAVQRFLESELFGVKTSDAATYLLSALALLLAAGCAALLPALRAARLDPLAALREE